MNDVAIVDYGLCNLDSVQRAVENLGARATVVERGTDLGEPDHIILPGVGAFPDAMANLHDRDLVPALEDEVLGAGVPLLGICLGMHLLATTGHEGERTAGIGWIDGDVVRLQPTARDTRVPHMGWNEVDPEPASPIFEATAPATDFYFVHSYHFVPADDGDVAARTPYADGFVSAVARGTVFGVQFHPEKSQQAGFAVLRTFLEL